MGERVLPLTLELLSPCFIGGAHQQPEFRIASLRGVWRYWYRALYGQGTEQREPVPREIELFGDTTGRGRTRLLLRGSVRQLGTRQWARGQSPGGTDYLLFSMDMNKRSYLKPGAKISLELRVAGTDEDLERAARSLVVALSLSGLGARARRMAGAVHVVSSGDLGPVPKGPAADAAALAARLGELLKSALQRRVDNPRYHVVAHDRFMAGVLEEAFPDWQTALDRIGTSLRGFRSRRQPDYGVAKGILQGRRPDAGQTITRAAFGLPITFRFKSLPQGRNVVGVQLPGSNRRGSPFFLTLERVGNGHLAVVWSLFRAPLSPNGKIALGGAAEAPDPGVKLVEQMLSEPDWRSHRITE